MQLSQDEILAVIQFRAMSPDEQNIVLDYLKSISEPPSDFDQLPFLVRQVVRELWFFNKP